MVLLTFLGNQIEECAVCAILKHKVQALIILHITYPELIIRKKVISENCLYLPMPNVLVQAYKLF
jgi:hypothetical protein